MESFTDSGKETYYAKAVDPLTIQLGSDFSSGIEFYKEDALKIIALITKAAA